MIYLFYNLEKYHNLLELTIARQMEAARAKDVQRRTKKSRHSKYWERVHDRCRKVLRSINSGVVNKIPIKLEKINFKVYARFLSTFKKTVKKSNIVGTVFLSDSSVKIRLILSSYDASCLALFLYLPWMWHWKRKNEQGAMDRTFVLQKGHKETGCKRKKTARTGCNRRKEAITIPCVWIHCKNVIQEWWIRACLLPYISTFMMEPNILGLVCSWFKYRCGFFSAGCFAVWYWQKKTDQEGAKNIDRPWNVYSNPEYSEIFPFLPMDCHLICNPTIINGQCHFLKGQASISDSIEFSLR